MNIPHARICPQCGKYMNWIKDHYECECGYKDRFMWRWRKIAVTLTIITIAFIIIQQLVMI